MPPPRKQLDTLVKRWAAAFGPKGIRVNAISPGFIDTDASNFTKTEAGRNATRSIPVLKRIGEPANVADVIVFVASDSAQVCVDILGPSPFVRKPIGRVLLIPNLLARLTLRLIKLSLHLAHSI
jgi:hypothetical protein